MNIAVVGSFQPSGNTEVPGASQAFEIFATACRAIGKTLGEGNHRLMVAHRYNPHGDQGQSAEAITLE